MWITQLVLLGTLSGFLALVLLGKKNITYDTITFQEKKKKYFPKKTRAMQKNLHSSFHIYD